jgi:hypothetical protein
MAVTGCTSFERSTFEKLAASQAVVNAAQLDYEGGAIPKTQAAYVAITRAKAMAQIPEQAMVTYEGTKDAATREKQQRIVASALPQLPAMIAAVEALDPNAAKATPLTIVPVPAPALSPPTN